MLFASILLVASASLSVLAAPIHTASPTYTASPTPTASLVPTDNEPATILPAGWPFQSSSGSRSKTNNDFGITGGFQESYLKVKEGLQMLVASYPKGSYAGSKTVGIRGFTFQANGGDSVGIEKAKEAVLRYQLKFPADFEFALAGKLPGLYGGDNAQIAGLCSGGRHSDSCWSARLMWREEGKGELYGYLPTANNALPICDKGNCHAKYGVSLGTGKWTFTPGQWHDVEQRVRLNDIGEDNGEIQVKINGKTYITETGVQLRSKSAGRIRGIMMHTFFGGSSIPQYKSPKDQEAYFKNFTITVTDVL